MENEKNSFNSDIDGNRRIFSRLRTGRGCIGRIKQHRLAGIRRSLFLAPPVGFRTLRYNDGTDTQQWMQWEQIGPLQTAQLKLFGRCSIKGEIVGVPASILQAREATLQIIVA